MLFNVVFHTNNVEPLVARAYAVMVAAEKMDVSIEHLAHQFDAVERCSSSECEVPKVKNMILLAHPTVPFMYDNVLPEWCSVAVDSNVPMEEVRIGYDPKLGHVADCSTGCATIQNFMRRDRICLNSPTGCVLS